MADGRKRDADAADESWTDLEEVRPEMVESVPIRHGMVLAGRYAVEKIIGRGGSGIVVRAHDRDLRQEVAIKIVRSELAGQRIWAARLAREVKLARQIHHPHVCRVFDFEQAEGRAFLVMELAENGTLREEIRSGALTARPLGARIADARAVASALSAIHAAGIVHRDLTPQNLLRMGDGRLVVSDFGLATDASESTSVHGGTVAYMAPEVLRGGGASVASDVWSLGVVMHEMVFGVKPHWSGGAEATEIRAPELGRKPTKAERAVLDACRACTVKDPARRLARAEEAGRLLTERRRWWARRPVVARRSFVWAVTLTLAAAVAAGVGRRQVAPPESLRPQETLESPLVVPTGDPVDWTDLSTVLVEVPDAIHCTRLLPDEHTIRFVWGTPNRAEDIDTVTRKRVLAPLVPAAYAEGCPDVSPDNKRLVYQGHAGDGRAFAFLSQDPDGRHATPVVPIAEPSMSSEPTWLNNDTFSFDLDPKHMAVFSTATGRIKVLPEPTTKPFVTAFRDVSANRVRVSTVFDTGEVEVSDFAMPEMQPRAKFRTPPVALDFRAVGSYLYYTEGGPGTYDALVEVDLSMHRARRLGSLPRQFLRHPTFFGDGLAFVARRIATRVVVAEASGTSSSWSATGDVLSAVRCGEEIVASSGHDGQITVERFSVDGHFIARVSNGPWDTDPGCARDGSIIYYLRQKTRPAIVRCDGSGCRDLGDRQGVNLAASPDGRRVAFMTADDKRGMIVQIVDGSSGQNRPLMETETACRPGWTSNETLWVSRRQGAKIVWIEVNVDTGASTGRSVPGSRDCADGNPDPLSPAQPDVRVAFDQRSQLRFLPRRFLPHH